MTVEEIYQELLKLSDEERMEIFYRFCTYCGSSAKICYCNPMYDE